MKIENLLLNNITLSNKDKVLIEGSILKGRVIELLDQMVLINIKDHGNIQATLTTDLKINLGEEMSFLVKSLNDNQIQLKPLVIDETISNNINENNSISKLLQNSNIRETKLSIKLVENLMKYNVPITERNLTGSIKSLEKIIQLISISDEDKVIVLNPSVKNPIINEIKGQYISTENINMEESNIIEDLKIDKPNIIETNNLEIPLSVEKEDIKNLLVVSKNDYPDKENFSVIVKEFLGSEMNSEIEDEYFKFISFFAKNSIKISLNNIKNLKELNSDPIKFAEDFKQINSLIDKLQDNKLNKNIIDIPEKVLDNDIISNKGNKFFEMQKLIQNFDNKNSIQEKEGLESLENKIDFLKDLNKELSFVFLPINYGKEDLDGILTVLKDKRNKKTTNNKINVYINLNTNNLGIIKVSYQLMDNLLNIKMNINKKDLEFFQSTEKQLIEKISSIGYILNRVEFVIDENLQIMDTIVSNPNPTYILDLKV